MTPSAIAHGRFHVEQTLGEGGMATVYRARDDALGRRVAVKVLAEHAANDEEVRERFVREARHAAQLSHPNVVGVFDVGEEDGVPFIVMEYVPGETLRERVRREGRLRPADAVRLALQACAGLEHAHSTGLVHRDVKPANLIVRGDGTLKIADFGIARAATATTLTQPGTILGTAAYLAPEQAAGDPVTSAADVYAVGAVLYELLTGRPPRSFDSLARMVHLRDAEPIVPVRDLAPNVPPALEDVVMRTLARRPDRRPVSAGALAHELEAALGGPTAHDDAATTEVLQARGEDVTVASHGAGRHRHRPRWAPAALAALPPVAVAAVAVAILAGGDDERPAQPPRVEPVAQADDPAQRARNFAAWLRERSSPSP